MDTNIISIVISVILSLGAAALAVYGMLSKYREKVDQLEKREEKTQGKIDTLRSDVDRLLTKVGSLEKSIDSINSLAQSHSPLALTADGKKLVEDSGFMILFDKIKDELADKLEDEGPSSQYDVQEKARRILSWDMIDDERFESIKDWAYKNGKDFDQILRLGSIPLRDYYFEKHPEIVNMNEKY